MEVFIVLNGKKEGPLTLLQLRDLLRDGSADGTTMGWMRGQEKWLPLCQIPVALGVIQDLEQQQLDRDLADRALPAVPPPPEIPYERLASHGVARFGARMIDVLLAQLILMFLVGLPQAPKGFPSLSDPKAVMAYFQKTTAQDLSIEEVAYIEIVFLILMGAMAGFLILEACLLALFGTTPGKFLFHLRVENHLGARPGFFTALGRTVLVFCLGMGIKLPVLEWLAGCLSLLRLQNRGITLWDEWMCTAVKQKTVSWMRVVGILVTFLAIAGLASLFSMHGSP